jgi:heterodisulfide reductase subunit B
MKVGYYPGCTLKNKAKALDDTTHLAVRMLGGELVEIPDWTCCGATTPLTETKIANLIAQTRLLIKTRDAGYDALVTTCPFCFSTLRRANLMLKTDELKRRRMNTYLAEDRRMRVYEEPPPDLVPYEGETRVLHLLEWFRDEITFDAVRRGIKVRLDGLRVAPFYGCQLLRPADEVALDDPENPHLLEDFLDAVGVHTLAFPHRIDCCGSYLVLAKEDATVRASYRILVAAKEMSADAVAVTCPLCFYNLDSLQQEMVAEHAEFRPIPILYFTQLLALALGATLEEVGLGSHHVDPTPVLSKVLAVGGEVSA